MVCATLTTPTVWSGHLSSKKVEELCPALEETHLLTHDPLTYGQCHIATTGSENHEK